MTRSGAATGFAALPDAPAVAGNAVIDVHSHVVPDVLPFADGTGGSGRWPALVRAGNRGSVVIGGAVFRTVRDVCWDLDARLAELDTLGVDVQVISPMPELLAYWAPPAQAEQACAAMNEWIADAVRTHPTRLRGLGIVPMQDPVRAAAMLSDIAALGLSGIEIGSNVNGRYAAAAEFLPVYAEASRLGLSVLLHTLHPPAQHQLPPGPVGVAVSFPIEIESALAGFIAHGVLAALPQLRLAASHGGGGLAMSLARLQYAWTHDGRVRDQLPEAPYASLRRAYFDTLAFSANSLRTLIDAVGVDRVLVGSDFPFIPIAPGWPLAELTELSDADRVRISRTNAATFLGQPHLAAPSTTTAPR